MDKLKSWKNWILILVCMCINLAGRSLALRLDLPIWFDAVGTIIAAIELGPLPGAVCGVLLNVITSSGEKAALPYLVVSALIGISAGLLYPRKNRTYLKLATAGVVTGLVSAAVSTSINLFTYGGLTGNAFGDALMEMIARDVQVPIITSFLGEAFVDIPDKVISFFVALVLIRLIKPFGRMMKKKEMMALLIIPLLGMSLSGPVLASDFGAEYAGSVFDADTGLESLEVSSIVQTPDGYMWAGTYSGLYRYDGYRFRRFELDEKLQSITDLFVDSKGNLWIATNDNGAARYDIASGELSFFTKEEGLPSNVIRSVTEDKAGDIYISSAGKLCRINSSDGSINIYKESSFVGIRSLASSGDTVMGIRPDGSVVVFKEGKLIYVLGGNYTCAAPEGDGNFILGSATDITGRVYMSEGNTEIVKHYSPGLSYFNKILYSSEFKGYFVCCEDGLGFISDKGSTTILTTDDFGNSIEDVCIDYQGNVWFASSKQGVKKFSWNPFEDIFSKANLTGSVVYSVLVRKGLLYAGTNKGLVTIDLKTYYSVPIPHPHYLGGCRISNIMCDSYGNLWFSTYGDYGLVELKSDDSIVYFNEESAGTEGDKFLFAKELSDGRIIAATNTGLNYIKHDRVIKTLGERNGVTSQIECAIESDDGKIFAGTDGEGIYVIEDGRIVRNIASDVGLNTMVVLKIVPCTGGYIYVTSNALYYNNGTSIKRLKKFPYSNNYDVFISDEGKAWVMSSGGIFVLEEKDLLSDGEYDYTLFNRGRGLQTSVTSGSNYVLYGDRLYISCIDGVRRISTTNYDSFNNDYKIDLSAVMAGDAIIEPENGVYNIPAIDGRIQFEVAVMNYTLSNPLLHIYLKGAEDEGITVYQKNMQVLTFTNLPYGDYELNVEVMDTAGNEVIRREVFPVHKESLLYEKPYFKLYLTTVLAFFVIYLGLVINNIFQNLSKVQKLQQQASNDPLTGLLNKRGGAEVLEQVCASRDGYLVLLDLDSFKSVNDLYGHDVGDRVLIDLSGILKKYAGPDDVLCRVGGDEFVAFYRNRDRADLVHLSGQYNEEITRLAKKQMGEDMNIPLGVSMGAVPVEKDSEGKRESYEELFKKADRAMYVVKNSGKHSICIYGDEQVRGDYDDKRKASGIADFRKIFGERGELGRAYRVDKERMQDVYRVLYRMKKNEILSGVLLRFAVETKEGEGEEVMDRFASLLLKSLRGSDIFGIDGHSTAVALLLSANEEEAEAAAKRIVNKWNEQSENAEYSVSYEKEML